jgi:solute carrier family 25 carnitine/acylcarnitine transporter 20/29
MQQQMQQMQPQPLYQRIVAGALAGISGWLVIYPLDVIKSRLQADALSPGLNKYASMTDCFRVSYRQGGVRSLYSGLGFTLLRAVPVASVILPCYDATYFLLSQYCDD